MLYIPYVCIYGVQSNVFPIWYDVGVLASIEAEAVGIFPALIYE